MLTLLLVLLTGYALMTELQLQFDLQHFDRTRAKAALQAAGLHREWRFELVRTPRGHHLLRQDKKGVQQVGLAQFEQSRGPAVLDVIARADKARRFLLRHLHLIRLDALVLLRTDNAGGSAILSGVAQGVLACLPAAQRDNVRIQVWPEFFRPHTTVQGRCILRIRLGILLLTGMMLLAARLRQQRATESEAA